MALITTVGGQDSNSFVTLVEADSRIASMSYDKSAWQSKTTTEKEDCLVLAAYALSRLPFRGRKVNRRTVLWDNMDGTYEGSAMPEQALAFPRTIQHDRTVIPADVKYCQIDIAAIIIAPMYPPISDSSSDSADTPNLKNIDKFRIGPLSVTLESKDDPATLDFRLSSKQLLASNVVSLRLSRYLTSITGRRIDSYSEYYKTAVADRITTTTSTTTTSTTTSTSTTTTTV